MEGRGEGSYRGTMAEGQCGSHSVTHAGRQSQRDFRDMRKWSTCPLKHLLSFSYDRSKDWGKGTSNDKQISSSLQP